MSGPVSQAWRIRKRFGQPFRGSDIFANARRLGVAKTDPALKCCQGLDEKSGQLTLGTGFECLGPGDIPGGRMSEYQLTNLEDPDEDEVGEATEKKWWTKTEIRSALAAWTTFGLMIVVVVAVFYTCLAKATQEMLPQAEPLNLFVLYLASKMLWLTLRLAAIRTHRLNSTPRGNSHLHRILSAILPSQGTHETVFPIGYNSGEAKYVC